VSEAELVIDVRCTLGEGPVWDDREHVLRWVDILGEQVHRYDPETGDHTAIDVDQPVGALALCETSGLALALRDGFGLLDETTGELNLIAPVEADDPSTRMNDGKCDRRGRFWAGTMAFDAAPKRGSLYCLDPVDALNVRVWLTDVTISNGLAWSADDRTLYYIDSATRRIDAMDFDLATGTVDRRRPLFAVPVEAGLPDGMALDDDGYLWVALWGGGAVHRYAPDGTLDRIIEVPTSHVSCCTFGGSDLDVLYITTARDGLDPETLAAEPHAGSLFRCHVGVTGPAPARFGI
jgi:sugar lactone lactonase YvrE